MKRLLLLALLLASSDASAAKLVSRKAKSYLPVFGVGSTASVSYTATAGYVGGLVPLDGAPTEIIRLFTTSAAYIKTGVGVTATAADMKIPAATEMILEVPSGDRVSIMGADGTTGFAYITFLKLFPSLD